MTDSGLIALAESSLGNAYCRYSNYPVCAVLELDDGAAVVGVNVENGSFGLTNCAERSAVFSAVSQGFRKFKQLVIVSAKAPAPVPCGACRQVLSEFCDSGFPVTIQLAGAPETRQRFTLAELLPHAFEL